MALGSVEPPRSPASWVCDGDGKAEALVYAVVCGAVAYAVASFVQNKRGGRPPTRRGLVVMLSVGLILTVIALAVVFPS